MICTEQLSWLKGREICAYFLLELRIRRCPEKRENISLFEFALPKCVAFLKIYGDPRCFHTPRIVEKLSQRAAIRLPDGGAPARQ